LDAAHDFLPQASFAGNEEHVSLACFHGAALPTFVAATGGVAVTGGQELFRSAGILSPDGARYLAGVDMPYTRPIRRFYLTPPSVPVFVVSVVLAILAVLAVYGHMSIFNASYAFVVLLVAYIVLLAGILFRGV
jgi:hypothetical protein